MIKCEVYEVTIHKKMTEEMKRASVSGNPR